MMKKKIDIIYIIMIQQEYKTMMFLNKLGHKLKDF